MSGADADDEGNAPTSFEKPPSNLDLPHSLHLSIPFKSATQAQTVYKVMSVDKPLRPKDTHIAFRILSEKTSTITNLDICVHTSTVRHMRLSSNAILDDVTLILETVDAFSRSDQEQQQQQQQPGENTHDVVAAEQEFELNGVGRAG